MSFKKHRKSQTTRATSAGTGNGGCRAERFFQHHIESQLVPKIHIESRESHIESHVVGEICRIFEGISSVKSTIHQIHLRLNRHNSFSRKRPPSPGLRGIHHVRPAGLLWAQRLTKKMRSFLLLILLSITRYIGYSISCSICSISVFSKNCTRSTTTFWKKRNDFHQTRSIRVIRENSIKNGIRQLHLSKHGTGLQ